MSALQFLSPAPALRAKSKPAGLILLFIALVSACVVETLHGHVCVGDGCVLCFVAACASALLAISLGAALACPIIRIISQMRISRSALLPRVELAAIAFIDAHLERVEMTPVTMGVKLLI